MMIGLVTIAFLIVGIPILLGVFAVALSALNYTASQINRGEAVTIRGSYGFAFKNFLALCGYFVSPGSPVVGGSIHRIYRDFSRRNHFGGSIGQVRGG